MILLVLALAAAGSDPVVEASPAIDEANREWLPALRTGDAATIAAPYAPDSVFALPDGTVLKGADAIRALYGRQPAAAIQDGAIRSRGRVAVGDSQVLEWGDGTVTFRDPSGNLKTNRSHYVTTWARQADGGWKISRNLVLPD